MIPSLFISIILVARDEINSLSWLTKIAVPSNILIKIINEIDKVDFLKEESANSSQMHTIINKKCGGNLKSIMGGAGGRFIIDELSLIHI